MKKFKQKNFSKLKVLKQTGEYLVKHPTLPISLAALGISGANYRANKKRQEEGKEYQEAHLNAIKELNSNIVNNIDALNTVKEALSENSEKLTNSSNNRGNAEKHPLYFIRKRIFLKPKGKEDEKKYSIQDGGFKGRKVAPKKSNVLIGTGVGAAMGAGYGLALSFGQTNNNGHGSRGLFASIGALIGAGVGSLAVWLNNIAKESIFNTELSNRANSYTLIKYLEDYYMPKEDDEESVTMTTREGNTTISRTRKIMPKKSIISPVGTLFNIDSDPKKHIINVILRGNVLVMLLNNPTKMELGKCNIILDNYCRDYKNADYSASQLAKNVFLVEVKIVTDTEGDLVRKFIDSGLKVNILTTDRFGINNR